MNDTCSAIRVTDDTAQAFSARLSKPQITAFFSSANPLPGCMQTNLRFCMTEEDDFLYELNSTINRTVIEDDIS